MEMTPQVTVSMFDAKMMMLLLLTEDDDAPCDQDDNVQIKRIRMMILVTMRKMVVTMKMMTMKALMHMMKTLHVKMKVCPHCHD